MNSLNVVVGQLYISVYEYLRAAESPVGVALGPEVGEGGRNMAAGAIAVAVSQCLGNPVDVIATRAMAAAGAASAAAGGVYADVGLLSGGAVRAVRHVVAQSGVRGLYAGYGVATLVQAPTASVWWGVYGLARPLALARVPVHLSPGWRFAADRAVEMACGVLAGVVAAAATNPLDVVRTRVQVRQRFTAVCRRPHLGVVQRVWQGSGLQAWGWPSAHACC